MNRFVLIAAVALMLSVPHTQALPQESRSHALAGADRLLEVQFENGAFPWIVGDAGVYQNVQGITALGLLEAYKVSLDAKYMGNNTTGAVAARNWIVDFIQSNPSTFISSSNLFFLGEYAAFTGDGEARDAAQAAFFRAFNTYGSPEATVSGILLKRLQEGHTNLGLWDAALFIRAASDIGWEEIADDMAVALLEQDLVDPYNSTNNWYELGLSGLLFALAEADFIGHQENYTRARDALLATQCENASFPVTWQGTVYCDDIQSTAYAVIGLSMGIDPVTVNGPCSFMLHAQGLEGGWDLGGYEIAEIDSEAVIALAQCAVPNNNGLTSYADSARVLL